LGVRFNNNGLGYEKLDLTPEDLKNNFLGFRAENNNRGLP